MSVVIDASAVIAIALPDKHSAWAHDLLSQALLSPARTPGLSEYEVASGLRHAERRGRMTLQDTDVALTALQQLPIRFERPQWPAVVSLSRDLDISIYDASYLEVAHRLGLPLVTADRLLADAARHWGLPVVAPGAEDCMTHPTRISARGGESSLPIPRHPPRTSPR